MSRISLWKNEKYGQDARWFDRQIFEQFTTGGVGLYLHKYLGAENPNTTNDSTQPIYPNKSASNIQDILLLENRDRKYDKDVYQLRGYYSPADLDLDLSQWGLMISSGTLFITVHLNNMVDTIGRKLMSGDVLELPNLKDFYSLDDSIPVALKRFYVIQDGTRPANGFSPTWFNHLWRLKCTPMTDAQEYADILNQPVIGVNGSPVLINNMPVTYGNISSSINQYQNMDAAIIEQAEYEVPESGYNTDPLWAPLVVGGNTKKPLSANSSPEQKFSGYLVGNGEAVDGYNVTTATEFPGNPTIGQYILRQDYFPSRLYRWSGVKWTYVNSKVRTPLTPGKGQTQRDQFINNSNTIVNSSNISIPVLQDLSTLLRPDKGGN